MSAPANTTEPATRSLLIVAAWRRPEDEAPVVGVCEPLIRVAAGGRVMLTISDVTDGGDGADPVVVALSILASGAGFVVRDVTHAPDVVRRPDHQVGRDGDGRQRRGSLVLLAALAILAIGFLAAATASDTWFGFGLGAALCVICIGLAAGVWTDARGGSQ